MLDSEARGILERVEHREELLVFEKAYGPKSKASTDRRLKIASLDATRWSQEVPQPGWRACRDGMASATYS